METLVELQLALQRFGRAMGAAHAEDVIHRRRTGEPWGSQQIPEHWDRTLIESGTTVRLLCARVADDKSREAVKLADAAISDAALATSEVDARFPMTPAVSALGAAHDSIGRVLRTLPPPSTYRPIVTSPFLEEPPERGS